MKFFPSKKVKITVDSAACVKYGIVPPHYQGQMVDSIYWTIKTNQLYKNDVMLLDLLASNKWKRPLYFAAPSSVNHVVAIDSFCLVNGWVYKFMPVKADPRDYIQSMGGVDALTSYGILKNKCAWGNLSDPSVYVDPESMNNSVRPKTNFMRVAQALADQGRAKEAIEMLDAYITHFPDNKVPFDMYMVPYAEIYYQAGATDKANNLMKQIGQICVDNLNYYDSFGPEKAQYFEQDTQTALGILRRLSMVASQNKQPEMAARFDSLFNMRFGPVQ
jgi:hypothetical protein